VIGEGPDVLVRPKIMNFGGEVARVAEICPTGGDLLLVCAAIQQDGGA
jgi:hypothetical protein